ncbi:MAG: macro domain-containing protein [Candidatus Eisenbacteria bacterium]
MQADVEIVLGSIVEQEVDAIVNAANTQMIMGSGVAAAILAEAGTEVEEEAMEQAPVSVGDVVVTGPGNLPARHVLHVAVVGDVPPDIYECTWNVLEKASEMELESLAIPALGTGSAGVSVRESARGICTAIADFLAQEETSLREIRIVLWEDERFDRFERALRRAMRRAAHPRDDGLD